jgi:hypothetical protein
MARKRTEEDEARFVYEERRLIGRAKTPRYDALAYARRALAVLAPRRIDVAIYEGRFDLRIERGRYHRPGPEWHWAMVAIPPSASRERIAVALAELAGVAHVPYVIDTLLALPASA